MNVELLVTILIQTENQRRVIDRILTDNDIEYEWRSDGLLYVYAEDADTVVDLLANEYIDAQQCA